MSSQQRAWFGVALAALFFVGALTQTSSCATTQEWLVLVGLVLGWLATAMAIRYSVLARGGGPRGRWALIAASLSLALIPAFLVAGDAGFMQSDQCCTANGCR